MVDLPLTLPASPRSAALTPATTTGTTAVQVTLTSVPSALEELTRLLQINATPVVASESSEVTLSTAYGNVTVALAQQLSASTRQEMVRQLMGFVQGHRSLLMTIQPGSPPTQGALIIPAATAPAVTQTAGRPLSGQVPTPQPIVVGKELQAVVLPKLSPTTQTFAPPLQPAVPPTATPASIPYSTLKPAIPPIQTQPPVAPPMAQAPESPSPRSAIGNQPSPPLPQSRAPAPPQAFQTYSPQQFIQARAQQPLPLTPQASPPQNPAAPPPVTPDAQPRPDVALSTRMPAPPPLPPQTGSLPQTLSVPQPAPQPPSPLTALLTEGNEVTLHIDAVVSPKAPPPFLQSNQILATVAGTGTGGQLILDAGDATLFVKSDIIAPAGTTLVVSVDPVDDEPLITLPSQDTDQRLTSLPKLAEALSQTSPLLFHHVAEMRIPQSTEGLAGALLFFFGAFKRGDIRGWLGDDAVDALSDRGKGSLISTLTKELGSASEPVRDPVVGQWQSYPIPLYSHQQFQAITLYVHNDRDTPQDNPRSSTNTGKIRFLIDMRLSKLGDMQVDGFVQPKKLDMILRSEAVLPEGLHHELRQAYIKALGAVGYTGALNFQVGRQFWMTMPKAAHKGIVT